MLRVSLIASFLVAAFAQRPVSKSRVIPASLAPAEILRQVMQLNVARDHYPQPGEAPDAVNRFIAGTWKALNVPDKWNGYCACSSLLLDQESRYVVLRMDTGDWDTRFLVFLSPLDPKDSWRLAGYADTFNKYGPPGYRLERTPMGTFLAVTYDTGGTGAFEEGESWFELDADSSREVLRFPTRGHNSPFLSGQTGEKHYWLDRNWESRILRRPGDQDSTVRVELTVTYDLAIDGGDSTPLFSKKRIAWFSWDAASLTYRYDDMQSRIAHDEFERAGTMDLMTRDDFIRYNAEALRDIAEQDAPARREWLKAFLGEAESNPHAQELLRQIH